MRLTRLLLRAAAWAAAIWLLLPVLQVYNQVILEGFNFMVDDSLVERRTIDSVYLHHELFWPVVLPRLVLLVLLIIASYKTLRRMR